MGKVCAAGRVAVSSVVLVPQNFFQLLRRRRSCNCKCNFTLLFKLQYVTKVEGGNSEAHFIGVWIFNSKIHHFTKFLFYFYFFYLFIFEELLISLQIL